MYFLGLEFRFLAVSWIANDFQRIISPRTFFLRSLAQQNGKSMVRSDSSAVVRQNGTETGAFRMKSAGRKGNRVKERGGGEKSSSITMLRERLMRLGCFCRRVFSRITPLVNSRLWWNTIRDPSLNPSGIFRWNADLHSSLFN